MFLKSILNENPESLIHKFTSIQFKKPTRGDWATSCLKNLEYLNINLTLEEIKTMKINQFRKMLKKTINEKAFQYLLEKRKKKGTKIKYTRLNMSEYLLPDEEKLSISDKQFIFSVRNNMTQIENNYNEKEMNDKCVCGELKTMKHLYSCKGLIKENEETPYEEIFGENVRKIRKIYEILKENLLKCK